MGQGSGEGRGGEGAGPKGALEGKPIMPHDVAGFEVCETVRDMPWAALAETRRARRAD